MSASRELAFLFRRDLARLRREIEAFGDDTPRLWKKLPGIENSAGNLAMHLEGNLREYIGRQLGGLAYQRARPLEFSTKDLPVAEMVARAAALEATIPAVVEAQSLDALEAIYPENVLGEPISTRHFLIHLKGHLSYHLGQINYLRRITAASAG